MSSVTPERNNIHRSNNQNGETMSESVGSIMDPEALNEK